MTQNTLEHITEESVKKIMLQFLKSYYKFRPRSGETVTSFDQQTTDGIIADGLLTFPKEDGKIFIASFEATSQAKSQEIRYKIQHRFVFWDGLAFGSIITAFLTSLGFAFGFMTIQNGAWLSCIAITSLLLISSCLFFVLFFRDTQRYRYIYAIEQFKRYHADEQWIAFASDVFEKPGDKYLLELKRQCVMNGFGLVEITDQGTDQLLITPAREEMFHNRKTLRFFNASDLAAKMRLHKVKLWWERLIHWWSPSTSLNDYQRYEKKYSNQKAILLVAFGLIAIAFYRQYLDRPVQFTDEEQYYKNQVQESEKMRPESEEYLIEKDQVAPYNDKVSSYLNLKQGDSTETAVSVEDNSSDGDIGLYVSTGNGYERYDCERINFQGVKYVVQDNVYKTFLLAKERIRQLHALGMVANCLSLKCINASRNGYVVFYELIYNNKETALKNAKRIKSELDSLNMPSENIKIRIFDEKVE